MKIEKTEKGNIYFTIYEVRGEELDGEIATVKMFSEKELAQEYIKFASRIYDTLFRKLWITSRIVWMN